MVMNNHDAVKQLHRKHKGEDIFVIGAGSSLLPYQSFIRNELAGRVVIGVNRTSYIVEPTYVISAYLSELLLNLQRCPSSVAIHCRPEIYLPPRSSIVSMKRTFSDTFEAVSDRLDFDAPTLITRNNVFFLASHLALVLGARRIIYLGFDMANKAHFYETQEPIKERMVLDLLDLREDWPTFGMDHPYETPYLFLKRLFSDAASLASTPFYDWDHAPFIDKFRLRATELGVEMISCVRGGVLERAGLEFRSLQQILLEQPSAKAVSRADVHGYVDSIVRHGTVLSIEGWAIEATDPLIPMQVIVEYEGEPLEVCRTDLTREDVTSHYDWPATSRPGFQVCLHAFEGDVSRIAVYALSASGLPTQVFLAGSCHRGGSDGMDHLPRATAHHGAA